MTNQNTGPMIDLRDLLQEPPIKHGVSDHHTADGLIDAVVFKPNRVIKIRMRKGAKLKHTVDGTNSVVLIDAWVGGITIALSDRVGTKGEHVLEADTGTSTLYSLSRNYTVIAFEDSLVLVTVNPRPDEPAIPSQE